MLTELLLLAALPGLPGLPGQDGDAPKPGGFVARALDLDTEPDGAVLPGGGLAEAGFKRATGFSYRVLLRQPDGKFRPIDEDATKLKLGDMLRVEVLAETDGYLYIFAKNPDNSFKPLVPGGADAEAPLVRRGQRVTFPAGDRRVISVKPPAGVERMVIFQTPTKIDGFWPAPKPSDKEAFKKHTALLEDILGKAAQRSFQTRGGFSAEKPKVAPRESGGFNTVVGASKDATGRPVAGRQIKLDSTP